MLPDFPDFMPLSLEHKDMYNQLVADYPPFSDISFTNLHIWWNLDGKLAASHLNSNLVLNYSLPFDPEHSGLGLIGTHRIDESLRTIFEYLNKQGRAAKVVNVPEFTIKKIERPQDYVIREEPDFHEYIMSARQLAELAGGDHSRTRRKVQRFKRETEDLDIQVHPLRLASPEVRQNIMKVIKDWHQKYPSQNDPERLEEQALENTLALAPHLETKSLGVFIGGRLQALALFHMTPDKNHYIINHLKVDYQYPYIFDFMTTQIAALAVKNGVEFLNMEMDLGMEGLRQHKMGLRPVMFYKKFTVEPSR
jgi:hypothetical protein